MAVHCGPGFFRLFPYAGLSSRIAFLYNGPAVKTKKEEIYREQLLI